MKTIDWAPDPQLMESMRAVGYTFPTAVADLIDNSVTAGATQVWISALLDPHQVIAFLDDGIGMDADAAQHAMRLAGTSATSTRDNDDLGRFGLGLKTASLSQCRRLTVVSKKNGSYAGYVWDLDFLSETKSWSLIELSASELRDVPLWDRLAALDSGTLVLWENLDRLLPYSDRATDDLAEAISHCREHLSLVFHRYLSGEHGRDFTISINDTSIAPADPLLAKHRATVKGHHEEFFVDDAKIGITPFTLPHANKLSQLEMKRAQVGGTFRESQGFYIYREKRLVIWGTWFRIAPKQELGKLARVRVDIPNTLDHLWSLDIKKSQAIPPAQLRNRLKLVADNIVGPSRRVYSFKGRNALASHVDHLWNVVDERGLFKYEVNRVHPLIDSLMQRQDQVGAAVLGELLDMLGASFPVDDVFNRMGQDHKFDASAVGGDALKQSAGFAAQIAKSAGVPRGVFVEKFVAAEPFSSFRNSIEILEEAYDAV